MLSEVAILALDAVQRVVKRNAENVQWWMWQLSQFSGHSHCKVRLGRRASAAMDFESPPPQFLRNFNELYLIIRYVNTLP